MDKNEDNYDIFVSYSHKDNEDVGKMAEELRIFGLSVFLAHEDIKPSQEWIEIIFRSLKSAKIFIPYLTESFNESDWCDQESGIAYANSLKILPVSIVDHVQPHGFIMKYQALKVKKSSRQVRYKPSYLVSTIVKILLTAEETNAFMRDKIFFKVKNINNYHETDFVFSVLEQMEPFSKDEINLIISEYEKNDQISGARSANSLVSKLKNKE